MNSNVFSIRDATEADLPAIVAIYNESIPGGWSTADTHPIQVEDRVQWFARFDPARRPIWVAEDADEVVGCVYLTSFYEGRPGYDRTAEISTYIRASHQGNGLGTRLKREMIAACPRLGIDHLISLYFDHNPATARVNAKLGFKEVGHLPEIACIGGAKHGLKVGLLRLTH